MRKYEHPLRLTNFLFMAGYRNLDTSFFSGNLLILFANGYICHSIDNKLYSGYHILYFPFLWKSLCWCYLATALNLLSSSSPAKLVYYTSARTELICVSLCWSANTKTSLCRSTWMMILSLVLQQCPACLVCVIWMDWEIGSKRPNSHCFVGCTFQDLYQIARSILLLLPSRFFLRAFRLCLGSAYMQLYWHGCNLEEFPFYFI